MIHCTNFISVSFPTVKTSLSFYSLEQLLRSLPVCVQGGDFACATAKTNRHTMKIPQQNDLTVSSLLTRDMYITRQ